MRYSDEQIEMLKSAVASHMSAKRFTHTLGVLYCAERLGASLLPDEISELKAAALLHDISKELTAKEHINILKSDSKKYSEEDFQTVGVLHSFTAPFVIQRDFPDFYNPKIVSAVYKHTLGDINMSVFDKIIFISDYIEPNRTFSSCISVRNALMSDFDALSYEQKLKRLDDACISSIDGSIAALIKSGQKINSAMYKTREYLIRNKLQS